MAAHKPIINPIMYLTRIAEWYIILIVIKSKKKDGKMKIYDISQELLSSNVYPGDKTPERILISDMEDGKVCNISELAMNTHNGTHMDAPKHFIQDGLTIDKISLEIAVGTALVKTFEGLITPKDLIAVRGYERVLFRGKCTLSLEAAELLGEYGIKLIGVESQSFGPIDAPMQVHLAVLSKGIAALEGLVLSDVPDGEYFLSAAPINIAGSDGSPCRAYLIEYKN